MTFGSEGPSTAGKVVMAAIAGLLGWQAIGPEGRHKAAGFLELLLQAAAEDARQKRQLEAQALAQSHSVPPPQMPPAPRREDPTAAPESISFLNGAQSDIDAVVEETMEKLRAMPIVEPAEFPLCPSSRSEATLQYN